MSPRGDSLFPVPSGQVAGAPEWADALVSLGQDIALVIDAAGVIESVAVRAGFPVAGVGRWVGLFWPLTLTERTRDKGHRLLQERALGGRVPHCEVGHRLPSGEDLTVAYSLARFGGQDRWVLAGRDLSAVNAFQDRFIRTQEHLERVYRRHQEVALRYRVLFELDPDGVLIVDTRSLVVVEGNPAAHRLAGGVDLSVGRPLRALFVPESWTVLDRALAQAQGDSTASTPPLWLADGITRVVVEARGFQLLQARLLRLRLRRVPDPDVQPSRDDAASICAASAS